jgi:DMSO/TMAO reductase YedYZ molybdopterin-dependent catalytic subunit
MLRRPPTRESVFRLIETADNFVKYARPGGEPRARERAMARYRMARELAVQLGEREFVEIATLRMADLDRLAAQEEDAAPTTPAPAPLSAAPGDAHNDRAPPGQTLTRGWPVLHEGRIPSFNPDRWRLKLWGAAAREAELTYDELRALGPATMTSDFHCVTGWSKLDNTWTGVWFRDVAALAQPSASAQHVLAWCAYEYRTNVPLEILLEEGFLAWGHDGQDLAPEHGWPLRLVVPSRYAWKSAKWVQGLEFLTQDRRGYWEERGYHNRADPWNAERYSYQE